MKRLREKYRKNRLGKRKRYKVRERREREERREKRREREERERAISFYKLFCPVDKLSDVRT